jgi:transposase InsO family protein
VNTHKNARLTYSRRVELVKRREAVRSSEVQLAREFGVSRRTVRKWWHRYMTEGWAGLSDRSSRPSRSPRALPRYRRRQIERRRRQRWSSLRIAQYYEVPLSTVVTVQRRLGLNRLDRLEPPRPVLRYEHAEPGALLHLDAKKLGRIGQVGHRIHGDRRRGTPGIGWEHVHVAIDDCTRLAYAEVLPREDSATATAFLSRAFAWFAARGIQVRALLTDNGNGYVSHRFRALVDARGLRHVRTRPRRPQTNGKAERFIRTLVTEWAYAQSYRTSAYRAAALPKYLRYYNTERRHTALGFTTPAQRLAARL